MGLPSELVGGHALEHAPRRLGFGIELLKKRLGYGHDHTSCEWRKRKIL
jgi:hypothetical protein